MIYGKRVRLRADERCDIPRFVAWLNDPEVLQGLMVAVPMSLAEEEAWFESMLKSPREQHPMAIDICQGDEWLPVGNCGFHEIDWRCRAGELGIFIGEKSFWNQGYGTEVMRLLVKHGFETLNLNRICLQVYATNLRAIRSYEKVGFVHEGRRRQAMYKNGQYIDILLMSILRAEWQPEA